MDESERQQVVDLEHLKILRIGYFVSAAMSALCVDSGVIRRATEVFGWKLAADFADCADSEKKTSVFVPQSA